MLKGFFKLYKPLKPSRHYWLYMKRISITDALQHRKMCETVSSSGKPQYTQFGTCWVSAKKLIWLLMVKSFHNKFWYPMVIDERWYADISLQPGHEKNEPLCHRGLIKSVHANLPMVSHVPLQSQLCRMGTHLLPRKIMRIIRHSPHSTRQRIVGLRLG